MKLRVRVAPVSCLCLLALALPTALRPSPRQEVPAPGWRLAEFIGHLDAQGIRLRVIPERPAGSCHGAFLTEDPGETWASFQLKPKIADCLGRGRGSVWVECVNPAADAEGLLWQWGGCGCRIGNFLLFGDERVIGRIRGAFR